MSDATAYGPPGAASDAAANISVGEPTPYYVSSTPPEPLYEQMTSSPGNGFVWIDGSWHWNGFEWVWVGGRWERDQSGYVYVEPNYDYVNEQFVYTPGYWVVPERAPHGWHVRDHRDGRPTIVAPPIASGGYRPPSTGAVGPVRPRLPVTRPGAIYAPPRAGGVPAYDARDGRVVPIRPGRPRPVLEPGGAPGRGPGSPAVPPPVVAPGGPPQLGVPARPGAPAGPIIAPIQRPPLQRPPIGGSGPIWHPAPSPTPIGPAQPPIWRPGPPITPAQPPIWRPGPPITPVQPPIWRPEAPGGSVGRPIPAAPSPPPVRIPVPAAAPVHVPPSPPPAAPSTSGRPVLRPR